MRLIRLTVCAVLLLLYVVCKLNVNNERNTKKNVLLKLLTQ